MAKNLKIKIKNTQLAKIKGLYKNKASKKPSKDEIQNQPPVEESKKQTPSPEAPPEKRKIRAKTKSAFQEKDKLAKPSRKKDLEEEKSSSEVETFEEEKPKPFESGTSAGLGPTGRHVDDLLAKPKKQPPRETVHSQEPSLKDEPSSQKPQKEASQTPSSSPKDKEEAKRVKGKKIKEFKDLKPSKSGGGSDRAFTSRDRRGLTNSDDDSWRRKRSSKFDRRPQKEAIPVVRPSKIKVRLPITVKDLAIEMKLKSAELIQKLFLNGMTYTLNDYLEDETTVQYLGSEFECEIEIDTTEEERVKITSKTIEEEVAESNPEDLSLRPPIVAFMGHVDHGKTSLIDAIRESNLASGEAGAITQHIGAFCCKTRVGKITVLDTPGHEAFSAMRARGADVTDIVVLVVAGDEGIREQTQEAIQHAKAAGVTIVVAINKSDKPNFNAENVYRQLSELELLPEAWGGQTITVNTSAVTKEGIQDLLEMLALQAEVLELKANPKMRARGVVLESELHKGMGLVATILVQNGSLHKGDALVFDTHYGRVKTMHDEHNRQLEKAGPSTAVEITGLSGLPKAGEEFIVVSDEKEARSIAEVRAEKHRSLALQKKKGTSLENLLQQDSSQAKKVLKVVLRSDVQGSLEALKTTLRKIQSDKVDLDIVFAGVGEISESDVQLAAASKAIILGFHVQVESHALSTIKEMGVVVRIHDVIYHAADDVKNLMQGVLDKVSEEVEQGKADVQATFKSSQLGVIAGCLVSEGMISRSDYARVLRDDVELWNGTISSLKRMQEDVKEVKKGFECGVLLNGFNEVKVGDIIVTYKIVYKEQEL